MTDPLRHAMSLDQFEALCDLLREQNEWVPPARPTPAAPSGPHGPAGDDAPGSDFNVRGSWAETGLLDAGWSWQRQHGDDRGYLTRPGKERGVSASAGMAVSVDKGWPLFWCWSTSVGEFNPDQSYTKHSVLAILKFNGDYSAAAKYLRSRGYGSSDPADSARVIFGDPPSGADRPADDGVTPDFDFATNADLKREDLAVEWVWPGWLQGKVTNLLSAGAGLGKTRTIADLCRRVHLGLPWPDGAPTPKWDGQFLAMWVAADRHWGELLTLSEEFGFGDRICYSGSKAAPLTGVTLNTPTEFGELYRKVKAARPLFLVVDTAGGATSFNLAKQEDARSFFAPLSDMAARLRVCVIVITHLNAGNGTLGRRAEDRCRVVIRMSAENKKPETVRRIEVTKSNSLFPEPLGMTLGATGNEYTTDAPPPPEGQSGGSGGSGSDTAKGPPTKVRECMEWLEAALKDRPRRVFELRKEAEATGFSSGLLYKAKEAMKLIDGEEQGYKVWGLRIDG